ncbi:RagB/SusD family nutrient uptake outer membrane protein [Pedobacter sp. MC2016-14]|uniref:RagB/SusD family nutrient uptake outer membrane protein n=1 Tax=Pedobacter sp. MC2016-14 TaxID=2897327 RepID=UPI001E4C0C25|nr:RagB/SusD family nutrient uptake outer membrane protein [Pedobacter sp. MC2016-14]MCD0490487.1 RagB/SusD family nutrient uptake outer membrane protein [Pedobacter sp. MC2016-14]
MKKYIYIIAILLAFTSCKKFLDVKPQSEIDKNELFSTENGFKEALNGVYNHCAGQYLYGGYLTFSSLDIMGQNYTFTDVNSQRIAAFDFTYARLRSDSQTIWEEAYRGIANCNNILIAMEANKSLFTANNYALIKGEALALRAYLHFDMLRLFAPSYASKPGGKGIPYVTTVTTNNTPFSLTSVVLDKAIADLTEAKRLLADSDPILSSAYVVGYPSEEIATETDNPNLFLQNRRHRMNYYSVCGELARVYLYRSDYANSLLNANIVINAGKFRFTDVSDIVATDVQKKDRIFYKEILTGWYVPNAKDMLNVLFSSNIPQYGLTVDKLDEIYERSTVGADDYRYKYLFLRTEQKMQGKDVAVLQKYVVNSTPLTNLHPLMAPAIRLLEMYYIAAESSYDTDPGLAVAYFNYARQRRGINTNITGVPSREDFINLLLKEARKEFYGESQIFYMYKRLNHAVTISSTEVRLPSDDIFVFPLPANETETNN